MRKIRVSYFDVSSQFEDQQKEKLGRRGRSLTILSRASFWIAPSNYLTRILRQRTGAAEIA